MPICWKRHPFPIRAHFDRVIAVSFAFPAEILRPLLARGLQLDEYNGRGFVTIALVWTRSLRPAGFPSWTGRDFFLAGYRIFARMKDAEGRNLRGLQILRSETDRRDMVFFGNLFTGYNYHHVTSLLDICDNRTRIQIENTAGTRTLELSWNNAGPEPALPAGSPFENWKSARRFAGPMPFTFSPMPDGRFVVVEGSRTNWIPRPVALKTWDVHLFKSDIFKNTMPVPANAFAVENIDYHWSRGRIIQPLSDS